MKRLVGLTVIAVVVASAAACAGLKPFRSHPTERGQVAQPAPDYEHRTYCVGWVARSQKPEQPDPRPLVWVLDGAGDLKGCSNALLPANAAAGSPLEMVVFPWSHGYRRLYRDQTDMSHARAQGAKLAQAILERKLEEPGRRVVVVAHSAGCAVALAACDLLPIDAVDRVLLLAPSVSTGYDIRPTLWSAKEGVDVFCSRKDWVALGFVVRVIGTTDNFWSGSAAGRWGFKPKGSNALADLEAARLRQHFWSPDVVWTGHTGGHHGMHAPDFVQTYLMPGMAGRSQNLTPNPLP
jgi:pimeloyl-ACP methyl ester carboxylesterase